MRYREALGNTYQEPKPWDLREISSIMNKSITGCEKHPTKSMQIRFNVYGNQRAWDKIVNTDSSTDGFI